MGILILSGVFFHAGYFRNNSTLQYSFGGLLLIYGIFRAVNTFFKMKNTGNSEEK
jgi:uncharacterized membrane protein HdeD (DUF308 family)